MEENNKHQKIYQVSWLNLHLGIDIRDVRKLIYKKLNTMDINMVEIAHNSHKIIVLDKSFSKHCAKYGYVDLYLWGHEFVLKFNNRYKYKNYIKLYRRTSYNNNNNNTQFCLEHYHAHMAVKYGHLRVLQWVILNKSNRIISGPLCYIAAKGGHLHVLQWLRQMNYPWSELVCTYAALKGHLEVLQWARANGCPWNEETCEGAVRGGHVDILEWAHANGCALHTKCYYAAIYKGKLDTIKWLYEHNCPWSIDNCKHAIRKGHNHIVEWIHENKLECNCN